MAELDNWVVLKPGIPVRLHFKDHVFMPREITDPHFKVPRTVRSLVFLVDRENGREVDKTFSILSTKLVNELSGYLEGKRYTGLTFTFIKDAPGTVAPRIMSVEPSP